MKEENMDIEKLRSMARAMATPTLRLVDMEQATGIPVTELSRFINRGRSMTAEKQEKLEKFLLSHCAGGC